MVTLSSEAKERINHIIVGVSSSSSERSLTINPKSESVRLKKTPGLVFGATSAGGELYSTQAGPRVIDDPASGSIDFENSVFWICSQTKLITCVSSRPPPALATCKCRCSLLFLQIAALQLVEQGKIQLDTPVSQILPEFAEPVVLEGLSSTGGPKTRPARSDITLRHLLNHSSGLAYETVRNPSFSPPDSYVAPHSRDNPVSNFFNLLKVERAIQRSIDRVPYASYSTVSQHNRCGSNLARIVSDPEPVTQAVTNFKTTTLSRLWVLDRFHWNHRRTSLWPESGEIYVSLGSHGRGISSSTSVLQKRTYIQPPWHHLHVFLSHTRTPGQLCCALIPTGRWDTHQVD